LFARRLPSEGVRAANPERQPRLIDVANFQNPEEPWLVNREALVFDRTNNDVFSNFGGDQ